MFLGGREKRDGGFRGYLRLIHAVRKVLQAPDRCGRPKLRVKATMMSLPVHNFAVHGNDWGLVELKSAGLIPKSHGRTVLGSWRANGVPARARWPVVGWE
jgi:hypothetical protein